MSQDAASNLPLGDMAEVRPSDVLQLSGSCMVVLFLLGYPKHDPRENREHDYSDRISKQVGRFDEKSRQRKQSVYQNQKGNRKKNKS